MGINGLFQTGRRSLQALEAAIQTAGQNIANAGTEGYSRQRLGVRADSLVTNGLRIVPPRGGVTGAGVSVASYDRVRDSLLDAAGREAQAGLGAAEEEVRAGQTLEGLFAIGTPGSLTESLASFWGALSDASDNPTDLSIRRVLQQRTDSLAGVLHRHDSGLTRLEGDTRESLATGVDQFNALTTRIADLNVTIRDARAGGTPDLAAEDERDLLTTELASFAPVRVATAQDGSYAITVQGMTVVQGPETTRLDVTGPPDPDGVRFAGTTKAFRVDAEGGGRLGGWLRTLTSTIPDTRAALDGLAARLVTEVNAQHASGYGLDGSTGLNFFDPSGTTAASLARSSDIADPTSIALAGSPDAPGDATVALALAGLREGFESEAASLTATAGQRLQRATASATASEALIGHFQGLTDGVSGVSIDEEMTRLIEYQQAYAASARVLATAQDLFDTLLAL